MTIDVTEDTQPHPVKKASSATRWVLALLGVVVLVGGVVLVRGRMKAAASAAAPASSVERIVPVGVSTVAQRDVPMYLEGLGNVLPLATVQVRTQVDGRLDRVFFTEGQNVKKGELLAQVDPRPFAIQLENAQAALARDSATLRNARLDLERYKKLVQQSLIPQQQVDTQQTLADQGAATVSTDQAAIDTAKLNLDYARITSPVEGVVGVRQVDPGNLVHAADTSGIVVVTQLDPIAVLFTLPQDDLPQISEALAKGPIAVDALSREGATKLATGHLLVIDNQVNTTTATIRLKAVFPNPQRVLWPNAFVKARLLLETVKNAIVVPATVVQRGPQGAFAYVVGPDKTVQMRTIEVDVTQGELAIVAKGLSPGEQVVSDGQNQLRPGAKIQPRPTDAAPKASSSSSSDASSAKGSPVSDSTTRKAP